VIDKPGTSVYIVANLRRLFLALCIPTILSLTGFGALVLEFGLWGHKHLHATCVEIPNAAHQDDGCGTCKVLERVKNVGEASERRVVKIQKVESCPGQAPLGFPFPVFSGPHVTPTLPFLEAISRVPTPPPRTLS
jgi:hypothetical protein